MFDKTEFDAFLGYLGEQLKRLDASPIEIVVSGGAALNFRELIFRATKDVDCLAFLEKGARGDMEFVQIKSFPEKFKIALARVSADFNLPLNWINAGPTSQVATGRPEGIGERLVAKDYGPKLRVHFIGRLDQIYFKLYAAVDQGGRHTEDLITLEPTVEEMKMAAEWCLGQDPSPAFRELMVRLLKELGYEGVTNRI